MQINIQKEKSARKGRRYCPYSNGPQKIKISVLVYVYIIYMDYYLYLLVLEEEEEAMELDSEEEDERWSTASVSRETLSKRIATETGGSREKCQKTSTSRKEGKKKQVNLAF